MKLTLYDMHGREVYLNPLGSPEEDQSNHSLQCHVTIIGNVEIMGRWLTVEGFTVFHLWDSRGCFCTFLVVRLAEPHIYTVCCRWYRLCPCKE